MELYCILSGNFVFKPRVRQDIVDLDILGRSHIKSLSPTYSKNHKKMSCWSSIPNTSENPISLLLQSLRTFLLPKSHQEPTAA